MAGRLQMEAIHGADGIRMTGSSTASLSETLQEELWNGASPKERAKVVATGLASVQVGLVAQVVRTSGRCAIHDSHEGR